MKAALDPWRLVYGQPYIVAGKLARALEEDLGSNPHPDFRTRLLVRDSARALRGFWGDDAFARWLALSPQGNRIQAILQEDLGKPGYRYIRRRLVEGMDPENIRQIFRLIGQRVHQPVEIDIAGSLPTLLEGLTCRPTDDIDVVNEVPRAIREDRTIMEEIKRGYGLTLGRVQSHYLPANWQQRRTHFGDFGKLRVYLADPIDVFVSKLSSKQVKHQDDLRVMAAQLDKAEIRQRLVTDGKAFLDIPGLREQIEANWQFLYGDSPLAQ
ncbi:MAG: DUF6036 family nucleotidyltransferase [Candidatus Xenobia bacterium]